MFLKKKSLEHGSKVGSNGKSTISINQCCASKSTSLNLQKLNSKRNQKPKIKPTSATECLKHTCQQQLDVNF